MLSWENWVLGVEDTRHVTMDTVSQTNCFYCFLRSFVLLLPIVLHQMCLLHQVRAGELKKPLLTA